MIYQRYITNNKKNLQRFPLLARDRSLSHEWGGGEEGEEEEGEGCLEDLIVSR